MNLQDSITSCTGAEVYLLADGKFDIRLLQLKRENKLLHIEKKTSSLILSDQFSTLNIQGPLALIVTGKGVLIKKTARMENLTEQNIKQVFPSFTMREFYMQHFISEANSFLVFVKKEIADRIIDAFKKIGADVLMLSLGPFVVNQIIPQLNNYQENLVFDGHQIVLDEQKSWLNYEFIPGLHQEFQLKIDIEPIAETYLISYAAAFQLLLNDRLELVRVDADEINDNLIEYTSKLKFQRNGIVILLSFLVLLILNVIVLRIYLAKNQELEGKAGRRSDQFANSQKMEAELKTKEMQVKQLGWNHGQQYAYLCDQIGKTMPTAITLHEITVNTLHDNKSLGQLKLPETGNLHIEGESASVYLINDWIYALKQKSWVKKVQLQKYVNDEQKGLSLFTLLISY